MVSRRDVRQPRPGPGPAPCLSELRAVSGPHLERCARCRILPKPPDNLYGRRLLGRSTQTSHRGGQRFCGTIDARQEVGAARAKRTISRVSHYWKTLSYSRTTSNPQTSPQTHPHHKQKNTTTTVRTT